MVEGTYSTNIRTLCSLPRTYMKSLECLHKYACNPRTVRAGERVDGGSLDYPRCKLSFRFDKKPCFKGVG